MGKVRRVDYSPSEYISGVGGVLNAAEQGVYWMICSLIMDAAGPIANDDRRIAGLCRIRPAEVRNIVSKLVGMDKLQIEGDGKLSQKRARSEVENATNRISIASQNGSKGGRPRKITEENQQTAKADGLSGEKLSPSPTTNIRSSLRSESSNPDEIAWWNEFWSLFPNKVGKPDAGKAFRKAIKRVDRSTMIEGLQRYVDKLDDRPWCNPSTWLNQDRWADQPAQQPQRLQPSRQQRDTPADVIDRLMERMPDEQPENATGRDQAAYPQHRLAQQR